MPRSMVRLSAGRESMSESTQALCFLAGANSIFTGEKLLTAPNAGGGRDAALFAKLGLKPLEAEEMTAGGIVLPDTAKEKPQRGKVLAVGPGRLLDSGERCKVSVVVGDEVLFGKYGGTDIEVDGDDVKILRESDILAKIVG